MLSREEKERIVNYLKQYGKLKQCIQNARDHMATLRAIAEDTSVHLNPTAGCGSSSERGRLEPVMLDIVAEEQKTREKIARLGLLQAEIENLINSVEDGKKQALLRSVYLDDVSPLQAAKASYTSKSPFYRKLDRALETAYHLKYGH